MNKLLYTSPEEIKEALRGILSSEEFTAQPESRTSLLKLLADWLKAQVEKYLKNLKLPDEGLKKIFGWNEISPGAQLALNIAGIAILVLFIGGLIYFIFRNLRFSRKLKQKEDALLLTQLKDPETVEQKAMEYYRQGDYRQGIRFLYIAFLLKLNERNVIRIDKAKTNRQYLNEILNSDFKACDLVRDFTGAFNDCWYGNKPIDSQSFDFWYGRYAFLVKEGNG